jgi:hypothetical protein
MTEQISPYVEMTEQISPYVEMTEQISPYVEMTDFSLCRNDISVFFISKNSFIS